MKKILALTLTIIMIFTLFVPASAAFSSKKEKTLRLIVPENWEMNVGDSRTVDLAANETSNYVTWSVEPGDVATVDLFGRVTALKEGTAVITAQNGEGYTDSVELTVTKAKSTYKTKLSKVDFEGEAIAEGKNLQKIVTRYEIGSKDVPKEIANADKYSEMQSCQTEDGAVWEITSYGVLRTDENAENERDIEQRFMGDRYFYSVDSGDGKVLAICSDGKNGIWTAMAEGYTHIEMIELNGTDKAAIMSADTQQNVARQGMVDAAGLYNGEWIPYESDNDGLWTSMYGAGELMRYAVLREDPTATEQEVEAARKAATLATEAVLFLTYISKREGTVESYARAQRNGSVADLETGKYYTDEALVVGGDYSQYVPFDSPATSFENMRKKYMWLGIPSYIQDEDNLAVSDSESWVNTANPPEGTEFQTRTRLLEGFWARTYSFKEDKSEETGNDYNGYIYWLLNDNGTATGISTKKYGDGSDFLLHNENYRGTDVNATKDIPERLWNDLIPSGYDIDDIVYKGDTSSDEIIGHVFLYKLAYDILGPEDEELAEIIRNTMESFAQHLVDNSYCLVDGTGQPTTWGKFSRTYLHNGQVLGGAPLQTLVLLCVFKVAAYVTGDEKWENEYKMAALDEQYQYAKTMTQQVERYQMSILEFANDVSPILGFILRPLVGTKLFNVIHRMIINYSDEEMAMLGFYILFQTENNEELLNYYKEAMNGWWFSIQYSENPLWYYIYQLAYPTETITDYYGNNILETASWALSRHPVETRRYSATNANRDDVYELDLDDIGIEGTSELSFDPNVYVPKFWTSDNGTLKLIGIILGARKLEWKVAAFDERAFHKYNGSTFEIDSSYEPNCLEGSTTYTLPYWMGRYHNMLEG